MVGCQDGHFLGGLMKFRITSIFLVAVFAFLSTGFVCSTRVEKMEADIEALQIQFSEIQKRVNNDQTQLTEMILRADKKLDELNNAQGQSHEQVSQQNVQLALELEKERENLAQMRGIIDVQQKALSDLQSSMQTVMGSVSAAGGGSGVILPSDQETLYQFIETKRAAGDRQLERAGILEFIKRYPQDARMEPLCAALAQRYNDDAMHNEAITAATQYLQKFPNGANRNAVIYVMGDSGLKIGNCNLAQKSFTALSSIGYKDADSRLKEAKKCQ